MANQKDEEPLDPKIEAIRQKMVRLLMVSGGIMMLGLMALLIAIVYKINQSDLPVSPVSGEMVIPRGAEVISGSTSDTSITLVLKMPDNSTLVRVYSPNGRLKTSYIVREE